MAETFCRRVLSFKKDFPPFFDLCSLQEIFDELGILFITTLAILNSRIGTDFVKLAVLQLSLALHGLSAAPATSLPMLAEISEI